MNQAVRVCPASPRALWHVAQNMREADRLELEAATGVTPVEGVFKSALRSDETLACWVGPRPAFVFGVGRPAMTSLKGVPWMVGTPAVERISIAILRYSKQYVLRMLDTYPRLENFVDQRNTVSIRWLKWCGFQFDPAAPHGQKGLPFHHFWLEKTNV